jgi:L-asparaginase
MKLPASFFKETHLPEMIARSRVSPQVIVTTLMMIDSLDMKPIDRELIANQCINTPEDKIILRTEPIHVHHGGHISR